VTAREWVVLTNVHRHRTSQLLDDALVSDGKVGFLLAIAARFAQLGLCRDRVAVGAERSSHALIEVFRAGRFSRDRPDAALERHVEHTVRAARVEPVQRESTVWTGRTDDREVVWKVRVIDGRTMHEVGAVAPPFEHRAPGDYLVRHGDVPAFRAPLADKGFELIERFGSDVFHVVG